MDEDRPLSREVYLAIAAVGWADGKLSLDESDAIVRTALEDGIEFDDVKALEQVIREPVTIGAIDAESMSPEDRLFVYAIAAWVARLDRVVTKIERDTLEELGDALGLSQGARTMADALVTEISELPEGDRPYRFDVPGLRSAIGDRLRTTPA